MFSIKLKSKYHWIDRETMEPDHLFDRYGEKLEVYMEFNIDGVMKYQKFEADRQEAYLLDPDVKFENIPIDSIIIKALKEVPKMTFENLEAFSK